MNRHFGRIFLILVLVILVVCLPGQAAQGGQAGPSASENDHVARVNDPPPGSAAMSTEPAGNAPATRTGGGVSSQSPVPARPGVITAGNTRDSLSETHKPTQAGNTPAGAGPLPVQRGDLSGPSDVSSNGRSAVAGGGGSSPGAGGENSPGIRDTSRNTGSIPGTAGEKVQGIPGNRGESGEPGRLGGMGSFGNGVFTRSISLSGTSPAPGQGAGHGPSPHRQQHGPPAHSASYPCGPAQASQLPPAPVQTRDESKEETSSRQRPKRSGSLSVIPDPVVPVPEQPALPLPASFFTMLLIGGFRRISMKNVLEHDARNVIYQAISATPGIDVKTLTGMTGINENTLRYHLDRLAATGKINNLSRPGVVRYFRNQAAFSSFEHRVFHYLRTDTPRAILRLLHRTPGLTRQQIADALMIAGPSVTRQMDHLIADGIVENRFPGRSNHYHLTAEAGHAISKLDHAMVMHDTIEAMPVSAPAG